MVARKEGRMKADGGERVKEGRKKLELGVCLLSSTKKKDFRPFLLPAY